MAALANRKARIGRRAIVALALGMVATAAAVPPASALLDTQRADYTYSGDEQTFTVPAGVTSLDVVAIGAPGAQGAYSSPAGRGARVSGVLSVTPGQTLYIEVGAPGRLSEPGFNGGAPGGLTSGGCDRNGGAGGGASDIRTVSRSTLGSDSSRVLVAGGGGGGGGGFSISILGGAGGDAGADGSAGGGGGGGAPGTAGSSGASVGMPGESRACLYGSNSYTGGGGGGGGLEGGGRGRSGGDSDWGGGGGGGGGTSLVPGSGSLAVDAGGVPRVTIAWAAPTVSLTTPTAAWTLDSSTLLKWSATAVSGFYPLAKFQVRYRRAKPNDWFNTYFYPARWQALSAATRQLRVPLVPGTTSCYSVRAIDTKGRASEWANDRCTTSPLDDRRLARSGRWLLIKSNSAYRGTLSISKMRGSKMSFAANKLTGGALVATKCPTCGVVAVKIGSRTVRINLYSRTTRTKQVIALPSVPFQTSVVVITVVSSGKPVIIDGLGIGRLLQDLI